MSLQNQLQQLADNLNQATTDNGLVLSAELIAYDGEVDVLSVTIEDREEFPIYISRDDSQILCITHVWREDEVIPEKRSELLDILLSMNVPMPLSAFSKIANQYIIFGALSIHASFDEILEEIDALSHNTLTAVEEVAEFLK